MYIHGIINQGTKVKLNNSNMACWTIVAILVGLTAPIEKAHSMELPVMLPEIFFANVAGQIRGGLDDMATGSKPCFADTTSYRKYRELDGRCNHPLDLGSTMKPLKRYIRAHYQDRAGIDGPRTSSVQGGPLPSPRRLSRQIHVDRSKTDHHTLWLMQLGQFIDHDITSAPLPTENGDVIMCCRKSANEMNPECLPIKMPRNDPMKRPCMEFVRSVPHRDTSGKVYYPREQMNALTSFLDGSVIYGSDQKTLDSLRTRDSAGALLKTVRVAGKERLPRDPMPSSERCLTRQSPQSYCQLSGDKRVNEQPGLGGIHLVFHLFHNHVVRSLVHGLLEKQGRPASGGAEVDRFLRQAGTHIHESLFQEARKLVGGVLQKITYCDWLPRVVGPELITKYQLDCHGRSHYNPYVDPRIANGFLTAAFRFGHSLVPNTLSVNHVQTDLKRMFMVPDINLRFFETIMHGMQQPGSAQTFDRHVSHTLTNHLFESAQGRQGALDLVSLNIQRGRDHGIPGYYHWREFYRLRRYRGLGDFKKMTKKMKLLYKVVHDVDLFVGGLLEAPLPGAVVGETFANIIAHQFADLKFGDAHFFMRHQTPCGFTDEQLSVIKNISLRDVICACAGLMETQLDVFSAPSATNPIRPCDSTTPLVVLPWMDSF